MTDCSCATRCAKPPTGWTGIVGWAFEIARQRKHELELDLHCGEMDIFRIAPRLDTAPGLLNFPSAQELIFAGFEQIKASRADRHRPTGASVGGLSPRGHAVAKKLSAVLLLAAAGHVIFYWGRVAFGDVMVESPIVNAGDRILGALRDWLTFGTGRRLLVLAFGMLLLVGLTGCTKTLAWLKGAAGPARNKREQT